MSVSGPSLEIGRQLEGMKLLAKGGTSFVFRAYQPTLDRYVVVKQLRDDFLQNAQMRERFRREAKALAAILHQNVAHVYDYQEEGAIPFLIMEFIDGIDLSSVLEKVGNLPSDVAAIITLQVARGLSYLHQSGFIHRDVKPANIRLSSRGTVKLMDLGIAIGVSEESLTNPEVMVGSPHYLSPEQILGENLAPASDLFALGICLYEMLTGTRPFPGDAQKNVFQQIRDAEYVRPRKVISGVPRALEHLVVDCLEGDARLRIREAKDVVARLEVFLGPQKVLHAEQLLQDYLEREALLPTKSQKWSWGEEGSGVSLEGLWGGWLRFTLSLLLLSALFGLGYWLGSSRVPTSLPTVPTRLHHEP